MEPQGITFIVTYRCPTCNASLEARTRDAHTWLRCPQCGKASLPPEHMRSQPPRRPPPGDDVLVIGAEARGPGHSSSTGTVQATHPGGLQRVVLAVGLLGALTWLVLSFLEQDVNNVMISGFATIVLFAILGVLARRR